MTGKTETKSSAYAQSQSWRSSKEYVVADQLLHLLRQSGVIAELLSIDAKHKNIMLSTRSYADHVVAKSLLSKQGWHVLAPEYPTR